jgi:hypothetical protein
MKKLIYGLGVLLLLLPGFSKAAGGELYLSPQTGSYSVGYGFDVAVLANTDAQTVNAIEAEIAYNPRYFEVGSISTDHSILTSWATPPSYDGASGLITFSGWAGTNYKGTKGLLITVHLIPLRVGQTALNFNSGAMLAVGGTGNIITSMKSGSFNLQPEQVAAPVLPPPATTTPTSTEALTTDTTNAQNAAAVPLSNTQPTASSSQAAAVIFAGIDVAGPYMFFFALLVLAAFGIAYYFHKKNIAF